MSIDSILALEDETRCEPLNSKAWQNLGEAYAQNDRDDKALECLTKAVEIDPKNLPALVALAVSHANKLNIDKALDALQMWLKANPDYAHIQESMEPPPLPPTGQQGLPQWRLDFVSDMYFKAAKLRLEGDPDPELQIGMALLYNLCEKYDKAAECFKVALTKRPDDYLLWNKLGATLSYCNNNEEAVGAYYIALEGKPTYVRALANLAISYYALSDFTESLKILIVALKLQPTATHLWDYLKMVFGMLGRPDLKKRASRQNIADFSGELNDL